jgi:hypothetical protein
MGSDMYEYRHKFMGFEFELVVYRIEGTLKTIIVGVE